MGKKMARKTGKIKKVKTGDTKKLFKS